MNKNYSKVIESLGEVIISKELDNSVLKYENERLKEKLDKIERLLESYKKKKWFFKIRASNTNIKGNLLRKGKRKWILEILMQTKSNAE